MGSINGNIYDMARRREIPLSFFRDSLVNVFSLYSGYSNLKLLLGQGRIPLKVLYLYEYGRIIIHIYERDARQA
jgi:hypothetical protein